MPNPKARLAEDVAQAEEEAADEAAVEAERAAQRPSKLMADGAPPNGTWVRQHSAVGARVDVVVAPKTEPSQASPEPLKRYDGHPFWPDAEKELEKAVAAFRTELVKKSIRAKNDVRGDVVSVHNVKTAASSPVHRSQPLAIKLIGMSGNAVLGAAFGALVSMLVTPPPEGLKPITIALLVTLVTLGTIGAVWQIMRSE